MLDPSNYRNQDESSEDTKTLAQRDYIELALHPPSKEKLLENPCMVEALHEAVQRGLTEEIRRAASTVLTTLSDQQRAHAPSQVHRGDDGGSSHVMLSYCWEQQAVVKQTNEALRRRGCST